MRRTFLSGLAVLVTAVLLVPPAGASGSGGSSGYGSGGGTVGGSNHGHCYSSNVGVDRLAVTLRHKSYHDRSVWHVVPTHGARTGNVSDKKLTKELWGCTRWVYRYNVKEYEAIVDQLHCHDLAPGGYGTGPTWDLEGSRGKTRNRWTWIYNKCNW